MTALVASVAIAWSPAAPVGAATTTPTCQPLLSATFLQPSYTVFAWSSTRYGAELSDMTAVGIKTVVLQWTVDMDAHQSYYPTTSTTYPTYTDMVGTLLPAAASRSMGIWLGLGNVYAWQSHAGDRQWLASQLSVDEHIADQLWARYAYRFAGWYVSNEVDDSLLANSVAAANIQWFFSTLAAYLHTHDGARRVMTSPTYSGLHESTTQFASSVRATLGSVDVLNVQDGGGSGYIGATDISHWFTALRDAFAGTRTTLWQDADMYASGGPMPPTQLQGDLRATCGLVSARSGFSFSTQLGPRDIGTSYYYTAYAAFRTQSLAT